MKLLLSLLLFLPLGLRANVNLLDTIKKGNHEFTLDRKCKKFIKKANHTTFESEGIKDLLSPLRSLNFKNTEYFHYTNDVGNFIKKAVDEKNFAPIIEHNFKAKDFLTNEVGGGLYLAANPFSSSQYGKKQVMLVLEQDAKLLDFSLNYSTVQKILESFIRSHADVSSCPVPLILSLLWDENEVDIVFYERRNEWFNVLNEDIILKERLTEMPYTSPKEIISTMFRLGEEDVLFTLLQENHVSERRNALTLKTYIEFYPGSSAEKIEAFKRVFRKFPQLDEGLIRSIREAMKLFDDTGKKEINMSLLQERHIE